MIDFYFLFITVFNNKKIVKKFSFLEYRMQSQAIQQITP